MNPSEQPHLNNPADTFPPNKEPSQSLPNLPKEPITEIQSPTSAKSDLKSKTPDNIIFVGNKPLVNYIRGIVTHFKKNNSSEVIIKSRGKFISKAVDIAEVARRRYLESEGVKIKAIKISSEQFTKDQKQINVSSMDITLSK